MRLEERGRQDRRERLDGRGRLDDRGQPDRVTGREKAAGPWRTARDGDWKGEDSHIVEGGQRERLDGRVRLHREDD